MEIPDVDKVGEYRGKRRTIEKRFRTFQRADNRREEMLEG